MIKVMLGGMSSAVSAAETIRPRLKVEENPADSNCGYISRPSAATVAGAEPETAPKAMEPAIAAYPAPPRTRRNRT